VPTHSVNFVALGLIGAEILGGGIGPPPVRVIFRGPPGRELRSCHGRRVALIGELCFSCIDQLSGRIWTTRVLCTMVLVAQRNEHLTLSTTLLYELLLALFARLRLPVFWQMQTNHALLYDVNYSECVMHVNCASSLITLLTGQCFRGMLWLCLEDDAEVPYLFCFRI